MISDSITACQAMIAQLKAKRHFLSEKEFDCGLRIQELIKEQGDVEEDLMVWSQYLQTLQESNTMKASDSSWDRLRKKLAI